MANLELWVWVILNVETLLLKYKLLTINIRALLKYKLFSAELIIQPYLTIQVSYMYGELEK
jgi:hypothetical protein